MILPPPGTRSPATRPRWRRCPPRPRGVRICGVAGRSKNAAAARPDTCRFVLRPAGELPSRVSENGCFTTGPSAGAPDARSWPNPCATNAVGMVCRAEASRGGFSAHAARLHAPPSDGDRQVLDLQRDALLAAGIDARHLFEARGSRAGLVAALAFLRLGDCLVVWKLDRLGRSLPHLLAVANDLKARGVAFRSLAEAMDTTTPQGELLFHVFGALAQFERSLTQERIMGRRDRRRDARGGRRDPGGRCRQGSGLPDLRRRAQHPDRHADAHRLVCRRRGRGKRGGAPTATDRGPDRGALRPADRTA